MQAELLRIVSTTLFNLGFAGLIGAALCRSWLRFGDTRLRTHQFSRLSRFAIACTLLCILALMGSAWGVAALMSDSALPKAGAAIQTMLKETGVGHAISASLVLLLILLILHRWVSMSDRRPARILLAGLLLLLAYWRAAGSHAAEHGLASVPVLMDWLHLTATAVWVGVVMLTGWLVLPALWTNSTAPAIYARLLPTVSRTATAALAVIVATGVFNAWQGLGSPNNLVGNSYGNALSIKLLFVGGAILLGAFNRFIGFPALLRLPTRAQAPLRRVISVLRLESLLLAAGLAAAAVLVGQAPPA